MENKVMTESDDEDTQILNKLESKSMPISSSAQKLSLLSKHEPQPITKNKKSKSNMKLHGIFSRKSSLKSKNKSHRRLKSSDFSPIDENYYKNSSSTSSAAAGSSSKPAGNSPYLNSSSTPSNIIKKSSSSHNKIHENESKSYEKPTTTSINRKCNSLPREFKSAKPDSTDLNLTQTESNKKHIFGNLSTPISKKSKKEKKSKTSKIHAASAGATGSVGLDSTPSNLDKKKSTITVSESISKKEISQDLQKQTNKSDISPTYRTNSNSSVQNTNNIISNSSSISSIEPNNLVNSSTAASLTGLTNIRSSTDVDTTIPGSNLPSLNSTLNESTSRADSRNDSRAENIRPSSQSTLSNSTSGSLASANQVRRFRAGTIGVELEECTKRLMGWDKYPVPVPIREVVDELENNSIHLNTEKLYMAHVVYHYSSMNAAHVSDKKDKNSNIPISQSMSSTISGISSLTSGKKDKNKDPNKDFTLDHLVKNYENDVQPNLKRYDSHVLAGFIKLFLRDLPKHILTPKLLPKFEHVVNSNKLSSKSSASKYSEIIQILKKEMKPLIDLLPESSKQVLTILCIHWSHVVTNKNNKVSLMHLSAALAPCLNCSKKLITIFIQHHHVLFGWTTIPRYRRPLRWEEQVSDFEIAADKANDKVFLKEELERQEWALNRVGIQLRVGWNDAHKSARYWEVQRVKTQLQRYLANIEKKEQEELQKQKEKEIELENEKLDQQYRVLEIEQEVILHIQGIIKQQIEDEKLKIEEMEKEIANGSNLAIDYEEEYLDGLSEDKLMEKMEEYISQNDELMRINTKIKEEIEKEKQLYFEKHLKYRLKCEGLQDVVVP